MRKQFDELFNRIQRPGIKDLYAFLAQETDFFTAPASTQYHLCVPGGLLIHSVNVAQTLIKLNDLFQTGFAEDELIVCGLLHDICKANYYAADFRNVKENGVWVKKPCFVVADKLPLGHGEKSVILLMQYIPLVPREMLAIRWHMSKWDLSDSSARTLNAAFEYSKLVSLLQLADEAATHLLEGNAE